MQITIRRSIGLVAIVAIGLTIAIEFSDGIPPRFVLRGIPARIERLRPGMSWDETSAILGLEKSWIWGGTSGNRRLPDEQGNGFSSCSIYHFRDPRNTAIIRLDFAYDSDQFTPGRPRISRLVAASFSVDLRTVARMPMSAL